MTKEELMQALEENGSASPVLLKEVYMSLSPIIVDCGTISSFEDVSDDAKKQLRRAYLRGTIYNVIIKAETEDNDEMTSKVIATYKNVYGLTATIQDSLNENSYIISCGEFQPEDYENL